MKPFHLPIVLSYCAAFTLTAGPASQEIETNPPTVARCLAALDTWIIAQPKAVRPLPGAAFPLNQCEGIVIEGAGPDGADLGERASAFIASASGVQLPVLKSHTSGRTLELEMLALPRQFAEATGLGAERFDQIGDQGYALAIECQTRSSCRPGNPGSAPCHHYARADRRRPHGAAGPDNLRLALPQIPRRPAGHLARPGARAGNPQAPGRSAGPGENERTGEPTSSMNTSTRPSRTSRRPRAWPLPKPTSWRSMRLETAWKCIRSCRPSGIPTTS